MKIHQTRNYDLFAHHRDNRVITDKDRNKLRLLEASMREYGFLPMPVLVRRLGATLLIIDGQHRYEIAKKLGLPVLYVETERTDIVIAKCAAAQTPWKVFDYVHTFASQGKKEYQQLLDFIKDTQLPLVAAAYLLFGDIGSGNVQKRIKDGSFVVKDVAFARRVAALVNTVRAHVPWALHNLNVTALARFVRVPEFDDDRLIKRVNAHPHNLRRCPTVEMFSEMYEDVYNFASKSGRIPLAFMAKEIASKRQDLGARRRASCKAKARVA